MARMWRMGNIPVKDEGVINVLVESPIDPNEHLVELNEIVKSTLYHDPFCQGRFIRNKLTDDFYALTCNGCGLRLKLPKKVVTIKDLKRHFAKKN